MVAGYCWKWIKEGKNDSHVHDIQIGDFGMSWNLGSSSTWAIDSESVNEIGCIHTCQGLEFDYVGVIIGEDMRYDNGIITDFMKRDSTDQSIKELKGLYKKDKDRAKFDLPKYKYFKSYIIYIIRRTRHCKIGLLLFMIVFIQFKSLPNN